MSHIVGGGGGGGGLTEDEVTTMIGRGEADGTAGLDSTKKLLVPSNVIYMRSGGASGSCNLYSGSERVFETYRVKANDYRLRMNKDNTLVDLLDASDRNGATNTAVAAIYNPCKTIFNEHRPVCTKEYHLVGKYLDGADNPDVWFPIKGDGVDAGISYGGRILRLRAGTGMISATRCVIDQTKFPISSNFIEVTCEIAAQSSGSGGDRRSVIGFMPQFSAYETSERAIFERDNTATWSIAWKGGNIPLSSCPLGRNITSDDIVTIRLDRVEGSPNINIARFYVNGQKQYETTNVPTVDVYAGIGVFNLNSLVDATRELGIKYFGVRYVP